ncbi:MAG TPA: PilZ domain-containing protein [Candidatus Baltobacteraceae bacterium]|nr:PilZ domain-containing protein [Candidatus Baltobacteraceae bacterium]
MIEHLSPTECRFRTVVLFEYGEVVEFPFAAASGQKAVARGTVVARAQSGPRFIYRVRLDKMSTQEVDELARTMSANYQRQAQMRSNEAAIRSLPTTERLTRSTVRVVTQFPIIYRTPKEDYRHAKAGDVSAGGLLMICGEALVEGEPVELKFTLPSDVLAAYPEETALLDVRTGTATPMRADQRRGFTEMIIGARVVNHRPLGNRTYAYGLAFTCIDGFQHEEIARYTHAVQRARNRH